MKDIEYLKKYGNPDTFFEDKEKLGKVPVQYLVGNVDFYGIPIKVNPNVLIPRFETEELVEKIIKYSKKLNKKLSIVDLGTGSGCIAIALAKKLNAKVTAVDISPLALETAKQNALNNQVEIDFLEGNMLEPLSSTFDIIVSNPPYIDESEEIMELVKNNEPSLALYAYENGTYYYRKILENAQTYLNNKGIIAFEIGDKQGPKLIELSQQCFPNSESRIEQDMQGRDRFFFLFYNIT